MKRYLTAAVAASLLALCVSAAAAPVPGSYAESIVVNGEPPLDGVSVEVDPVWTSERSQYAHHRGPMIRMLLEPPGPPLPRFRPSSMISKRTGESSVQR